MLAKFNNIVDKQYKKIVRQRLSNFYKSQHQKQCDELNT